MAHTQDGTGPDPLGSLTPWSSPRGSDPVSGTAGSSSASSSAGSRDPGALVADNGGAFCWQGTVMTESRDRFAARPDAVGCERCWARRTDGGWREPGKDAAGHEALRMPPYGGLTGPYREPALRHRRCRQQNARVRVRRLRAGGPVERLRRDVRPDARLRRGLRRGGRPPLPRQARQRPVAAQRFGRCGATYGTIAGVIVLMLWLWLSSLIVLLGAMINAELERQSAAAPRRPGPHPR